MRLEQRRRGHDEADVVDVSHHAAAVDAGGAGVDSNADGEEEGVVDGGGDGGGVVLGVEAAEGVHEGGGDWGRVSRGGGGEGGGGEGGGGVVAEGGCGDLVVGGYDGVHEGGDGDYVFSDGVIGVEEGVGGLAWPDEDGVGGEGLCVGGVDLDDGEAVAGDLEEELFVHCCVYDAEEVCFAALYVETVAFHIQQLNSFHYF